MQYGEGQMIYNRLIIRSINFKKRGYFFCLKYFHKVLSKNKLWYLGIFI